MYHVQVLQMYHVRIQGMAVAVLSAVHVPRRSCYEE